MVQAGNARMDYERAVLSGSPMTRPTFSRNLRPSAQQVIFFVEELTFFPMESLETNIQPRRD
jgi:hypothetical protein